MRVVRASPELKIKRYKLPMYPIVLLDRGGVALAIDDYLHHGATRRSQTIGSLADEAYILKGWWAWAHHPSRISDSISSDLFSEWHGEQVELREERGTSGTKGRARIDRCLAVIQAFNKFLLKRRRRYAGLPSQASIAAYVARLDASDLMDPDNRIKYASRPERTGPGRPTPTPVQAESVLEALVGESNDAFASRNYLIGRWMFEVGLRAGGVASLSVGAIMGSLREVGLSPSCCEAAAGNDVGVRQHVLRFLASETALGRATVQVDVIEKGPTLRKAGASLDLIEATLRHVWQSVVHSEVDAIFPSRKTKKGLTAGAIGDLAKDAFNATHTRGSGHRLRAAFAETTIFELCQKRTPGGVRFDDDIILFEAAQKLGQRSTKSLRPYLNNVLRNWHLLEEAYARKKELASSQVKEVSASQAIQVHPREVAAEVPLADD